MFLLGHRIAVYQSLKGWSLDRSDVVSHFQTFGRRLFVQLKNLSNGLCVGSIVAQFIGQRLRPLSYIRQNPNIATSPLSRRGTLQAGSAASHMICISVVSVSNTGRNTDYPEALRGISRSKR
jgi:hypothetical protein